MKLTEDTLKAECLKQRMLAKKGGRSKIKNAGAYWLGYDRACFEIQKRFNLLT